MANDDLLRQYVERPEGQFLDRKSGRIAPRELAVDLLALTLTVERWSLALRTTVGSPG
jgi:hypothetical protein